MGEQYNVLATGTDAALLLFARKPSAVAAGALKNRAVPFSVQH